VVWVRVASWTVWVSVFTGFTTLAKVVLVAANVIVVEGVAAVTVFAVAPMHEQALENCATPEHGEAYAGSVAAAAGIDTILLSGLFPAPCTVAVTWSRVVDVSCSVWTSVVGIVTVLVIGVVRNSVYVLFQLLAKLLPSRN
jgi:hypothetical protein